MFKKITVFDSSVRIKPSLETWLTASFNTKSPPLLIQTAGILYLWSTPAGPGLETRNRDDASGWNLRRNTECHDTVIPNPYQIAPTETACMPRIDANALPGCVIPYEKGIRLNWKHRCQQGHFCHLQFVSLVQHMRSKVSMRKKTARCRAVPACRKRSPEGDLFLV